MLPVVNTLLGFAHRLDDSVLGAVLLLRDGEGDSCLMTATAYRHSGIMRALLEAARMAGVEQQLLTMTDDEGDSCLKYAVQASDEAPWPAERQSAPVLAALLDGPFARELVMIVLLLFLQKQSLAFAVYLFGIGTLHTGPGLKKKTHVIMLSP